MPESNIQTKSLHWKSAYALFTNDKMYDLYDVQDYYGLEALTKAREYANQEASCDPNLSLGRTTALGH